MATTITTEFLLNLYERFGKDAQAALDFVRKNINVDVENNNIIASNVPQLIDLGLPSGTKWADRNIGADSPNGYGLLFSWGNVDGHSYDSDYDFDEYDKTDGASIGEKNLIDGHLAPKNDAATHNWGSPWRMPTEEEFKELNDNCNHKFTERAGVRGMLFTSKINGASVFFPCSGRGRGSSRYGRSGYGIYWSSSFYSSRSARCLYFNSGGVYPQCNDVRFYGFAVRPVK